MSRRRRAPRHALVIIAMALAVAGVIVLARVMMAGETARLDRAILLAFRVAGHLGTPIGPRWVRESARDISALGGFTVLTLISVFAMGMMVAHSRPRRAAVFAAGVIGAQVVAEGIKALVGRPRPDVVPPLDLVYSASFPSGHALMSPVVYLTLAALLASAEPRPAGRAILLGGAAILVIAVGLSRLYLGVHWPTDVLAGWIMGGAIAGGLATYEPWGDQARRLA